MTTDGQSRPRQAAEAVDAGEGHGQRFRSEARRTTTVPVIPLWDRPRTGVRG